MESGTDTHMTANIPPKQTVTGSPAAADPAFGQPYAAPSDPPGALVSIHNAALHANPDSFPVLKAFQDYLETERQRARQRLILLHDADGPRLHKSYGIGIILSHVCESIAPSRSV